MDAEKQIRSWKRRNLFVGGMIVLILLTLAFGMWMKGQDLSPRSLTVEKPHPEQKSERPDSPHPEKETALRDVNIRQKVDEIKAALRIGLTQAEVLGRIPGVYSVVDDGGDLENGADEHWSISFFRQPDYVPEVPGHVIDEEGLESGRVGANLFISWKEKKLYLYSITYVQGPDNEIHFYWMRPNGTVGLERLNEKAPPTVFDLGEKEMDLYFLFMETNQEEILRGVEPADILKLYLFAMDEGHLRTQYAFYAEEPELEKPSLEQFLADVRKDAAGAEKVRQWLNDLKANASGFELRMIDRNLPAGSGSGTTPIDQGQAEEALVLVKFTDHREPFPFHFRKNQQGIWKVRWMPLH